MADKKLNEVPKVTDMAYVPVIMADGSVGQIAKSDLASVVAGIMGNPLGFKGDKSSIDANKLTSTGLYYLSSNITNAMNWSFLIVFQFGNANDVVQFNIHNGAGEAKYRKCSSGEWYGWVSL